MFGVSEEDVGSLDYCGEAPSSGPRGQTALGFQEKSMLIRNSRDLVLSAGNLSRVNSSGSRSASHRDSRQEIHRTQREGQEPARAKAWLCFLFLPPDLVPLLVP